ncbi:MAG: hypothetical protein AAF363_08305 [Bacteroidota bacterium]
MTDKIIGWVLYIGIIAFIMGGIVESTDFVFEVIYNSTISSLTGSLFLYVIDIVLIITILVIGYVGINFVNTRFLDKG